MKDGNRIVESARADACIVGGGPAGLLLGLLLAKRGARVIVVEGHPNFDRKFRGAVLQPRTSRLLDQLGLLEYFFAQPHLKLTERIDVSSCDSASGNLFVQQHLTDPRECSGRERLGEVEQAEADGEARHPVAAFGDAIETTAGDLGHEAVTAQLGDDAADARAATLQL